MSDLSERAKALIHETRNEHDPTDRDRDQVRNGLRARLGASAAAGAALGAARQATALGGAARGGMAGGWLSRIPTLTKWIGVGVLVAAGGIGGYSLLHQPAPAFRADNPSPIPTPSESVASPAPTEPPSSQPLAVVAPPPPASAKAPERIAMVDPRASRSANPAPVPSQSAPTGPGLAEEARSLAEAQMVMQSGDPERAMAMIDEQSKKYKDGALQEERAAARLFVLCKSQREGSRAAALQFIQNYPNSPLVDRVRSECLTSRP